MQPEAALPGIVDVDRLVGILGDVTEEPVRVLSRSNVLSTLVVGSEDPATKRVVTVAYDTLGIELGVSLVSPGMHTVVAPVDDPDAEGLLWSILAVTGGCLRTRSLGEGWHPVGLADADPVAHAGTAKSATHSRTGTANHRGEVA